MKKLNLLTLIIFISQFSCSTKDDVIPDDEIFSGRFDISVTGDFTKTIEGEAAFIHGILTSGGDDENGSIISMAFTDEEENGESITILLSQPGNLDGISTGTYTVDLDPEDGDPSLIVSAILNGSITYLSTSGELKLSKVTDSKVEGSLNVMLLDNNENNISITGTFEAFGYTRKF